MEIEMRKGEANIACIIRNIEGDMGEEEKLSLTLQEDGDVIVTVSTKTNLYSVEFCTSAGGGRRPVIAKKLRELMAELVKEES